MCERRVDTDPDSNESRHAPAPDLQVFWPELPATSDGTTRDHELAAPTVVNRPRSLRRHGDVSDLPDEQAVCSNHASVTQTAFGIRVALRDQGRGDLCRPFRRQAKPLELVGTTTAAIADADDRVKKVERRQIDDTLLRASEHVVAVVLVPDVAAEQRGRKSEHHVPTHGHDVRRTFP
jgi:hypothetical protein